MKTLVAGLLLATVSAAAASDLTETESQIVSIIDDGIPDAMILLEKTVNMNSGTMNFEGVEEVAKVFAAEFQELGFKVDWSDGAEWGRAGHMIATRHAPGEVARILFIGHIDTVFELDSPFQKFEMIDEFTAKGPGVIDMKGGIAVMLLALNALHETGALEKLSITVVLGGDEEKSGSPIELARRDLREAAEWADIAIGFEDGDGDPETAVVARRGSSSWTLTTTGTPGHSSQVFGEKYGSGAIYECARILNAFHEELSREKYLTFNPGVILGGTDVQIEDRMHRGSAAGKLNIIAKDTVVRGDIRSLSLEQLERAKQKMLAIVEDHLPRTDARIVFDDRYPPLAPTDGNRELLSWFDQASRDLGLGEVAPVDPAKAGAADVSFTAGLVEMAMDGVGLMGDGGHTEDEVADLRTLPVQAKRMAVMLHRLANSR